jgi:hypothetical protein
MKEHTEFVRTLHQTGELQWQLKDSEHSIELWLYWPPSVLLLTLLILMDILEYNMWHVLHFLVGINFTVTVFMVWLFSRRGLNYMKLHFDMRTCLICIWWHILCYKNPFPLLLYSSAETTTSWKWMNWKICYTNFNLLLSEAVRLCDDPFLFPVSLFRLSSSSDVWPQGASDTSDPSNVKNKSWNALILKGSPIDAIVKIHHHHQHSFNPGEFVCSPAPYSIHPTFQS